MRRLTESKGLISLITLQNSFKEEIHQSYEYRAKECSFCETKGICCTDSHFVNVQITRLEAIAIAKVIDELPLEKRKMVREMIKAVADELETSGDKNNHKTYSCPLFDDGCIVHSKAKPLPCITHGCYKSAEELPPDRLLEAKENEVARLNTRVYGNAWNWLSLPNWLDKIFRD